MIFDKIGVLRDILEHRFGGGGVVARIGKTLISFTKSEIFIITDKMMGIAANVKNGNCFNGVLSMKPIAVELDNLVIKWGVVSIAGRYIEFFDISFHFLHSIAPLDFLRLAGTHCLYINRAFIRVICGSEQREIIPNLGYNKIAVSERFTFG